MILQEREKEEEAPACQMHTKQVRSKVSKALWSASGRNNRIAYLEATKCLALVLVSYSLLGML